MSQFPEPTMEELPSGAPPVWAIVLAVVSIAVLFGCLFVWVFVP